MFSQHPSFVIVSQPFQNRIVKIVARQPTILLTCHGSLVNAPDPDVQLVGLLTNAF
jgi:hypothetical protein